jgi:hypothetical protein
MLVHQSPPNQGEISSGLSLPDSRYRNSVEGDQSPRLVEPDSVGGEVARVHARRCIRELPAGIQAEAPRDGHRFLQVCETADLHVGVVGEWLDQLGSQEPLEADVGRLGGQVHLGSDCDRPVEEARGNVPRDLGQSIGAEPDDRGLRRRAIVGDGPERDLGLLRIE